MASTVRFEPGPVRSRTASIDPTSAVKTSGCKTRRAAQHGLAPFATVTPSAFVEQVRVDTARKLLKETDAPLKTVAFNCGFHSATHMRTIFFRRLNVTPRQYRQRFRGTAGKQQWVSSGANEQVESAGTESVR